MIENISVTPGKALQNPNMYQYQSHGHISNRKKVNATNAAACAKVAGSLGQGCFVKTFLGKALSLDQQLCLIYTMLYNGNL